MHGGKESEQEVSECVKGRDGNILLWTRLMLKLCSFSCVW